MIKNLLKTIFVLLIAVLSAKSVSAQVSLVDSVSNLQTCNGPQRMKLNFSGLTGLGSATRTVDVLLPVGNEMGSLVSSSVTGGGAVALLAGTQPNGAFRFEVTGGLPQLRGGTEYTNISITAQSNPSIEANIQTIGTEHGETVTFDAAFADTYIITVEDASGCIATDTIDMTNCEPVTFTAPDVVARPNDVICTDITVSDFNGMLGFNFNLEWDPSIVTFNSPSKTTLKISLNSLNW